MIGKLAWECEEAGPRDRFQAFRSVEGRVLGDRRFASFVENL